MKMSKHTGPWSIDDHSIRDSNGYDILRVGVDVRDNPFFSFGSDEAQYIVMAAPEMLAALEAIDSIFDLGDFIPDNTAFTFANADEVNAAFAKARAALKKARGEP